MMNIDAVKILDSIDQYVFLKDIHGVYLYANEAFVKMAGLGSKEAIVGKTDRHLVWKEHAHKIETSDKLVLAGKPLFRCEETRTQAIGPCKIILTKTPYRAENGDIIGILGNFFDCTDHLVLKTQGTFDEDKHRLYLEFVPDWLSASEVRVFFYLIHGFSAVRIAEKIGTSVSTVRFHIENIKGKMQCDNKNEIVDVAMRTGIAWKIFTLQHVGDTDSSSGQ